MGEWRFDDEVMHNARELAIGDRVMAHYVEAECPDEEGTVVGIEIGRYGKVTFTVLLDRDEAPTTDFVFDRSGMEASSIRLLSRPQQSASAAKEKAEFDKLVEFFNGDGYQRFGCEGDVSGWTPAETAINAMKELLRFERGERSLTSDVTELVVAAREVFDTYAIAPDPDGEIKRLDKALEAFSERVPYENQPDATGPVRDSAELVEALRDCKTQLEYHHNFHQQPDLEMKLGDEYFNAASCYVDSTPEEATTAALAKAGRALATLETGEGWKPTEKQIELMVNSFLQWKLPEDFAPDCGIEFDAYAAQKLNPNNGKYEPVGTNLFTATQAKQMVLHMLAALDTQGGA